MSKFYDLGKKNAGANLSNSFFSLKKNCMTSCQTDLSVKLKMCIRQAEYHIRTVILLRTQACDRREACGRDGDHAAAPRQAPERGEAVRGREGSDFEDLLLLLRKTR